MGCFWGDDDPFRSGEYLSSFKNLILVVSYTPHYPIIHKPGYNWGVPMITETSCVYGGGNKVMSEREHLEEGGITSFIGQVVREQPFCQCWAGCRFNSD